MSLITIPYILSVKPITFVQVKLKNQEKKRYQVYTLTFEELQKNCLKGFNSLPYLINCCNSNNEQHLIYLLELGYDKYEDLDPELHKNEIEYFLKVKKKWMLLNQI